MQKQYISPRGIKNLKEHLRYLLYDKRPRVTKSVSEAAALGDRSENAEYKEGKRELRTIDKKIYFLTKKIQTLQVIDNQNRKDKKIYFGATVIYLADDKKKEATILGMDEIDLKKNKISYISPLAKFLIGKSQGDKGLFHLKTKKIKIEILKVDYQ